MDAKLIVIGGKANKSEVKLKLPTTIGRSRKADLTVAHPKVSRQHCEIFERDGVLMVKDFGSLNGTFIENNRITESVLKPGDKLTVGPLTFVAVYEPAGPFPAELPDPADLPTPAIAPMELPTTNAKVGRGAADTIAARPLKPRPRPIAPPPPPPEVPAETTADAELPQTPTLPAEAAEPEADDFSWLTGDTVPVPAASDEEKPAVSPAFAETVNLKRAEPQAEPPAPELLLSDEPLAAAEEDEGAGADALANPPETDPQDFSWLDNAKDEPLNFSAFEEGVAPSLEPPSASSPSADSERTTVQHPGPTEKLSKTVASAAPSSTPAAPVDPPPAEEPEDLAFEADAAAPAEEPPPALGANLPALGAGLPTPPKPSTVGLPAPAEGIPDFAALAQSSTEEAPVFPPIVADRPAVGTSPASGASPPPRTAAKVAKPKAWWPFAAKKKDEPKSKTPASPSDPAPAPVKASAEPEAAAAPAPSAAPVFVLPAAEEPAAEPAVAEESTGGEDDALGQFFKSLK